MINLFKIILSIVMIAFSTIFLYGQESDTNCSEFWVGNYYYPMIKDNGNTTVRTKSRQVSYIKKSDMTLTWKMSWKGDCSYEMVLKKIKNNDGIYKVGDRIVTEIIIVEDKCYYFEAVFYSEKYPDGKKFPQGKLCKE